MMQNNGPSTLSIQPQARPQLGLVGRLVRQPGVAIARRNMRVLGGVPGHLVDAVQDPGELPGAMVQQAVEAHAELGRLDLARVGRAHGRDVIGEMQAGLQEADLAVVLDALDGGKPAAADATRPAASAGKLPWKAMLWIVCTVAGRWRRRAPDRPGPARHASRGHEPRRDANRGAARDRSRRRSQPRAAKRRALSPQSLPSGPR